MLKPASIVLLSIWMVAGCAAHNPPLPEGPPFWGIDASGTPPHKSFHVPDLLRGYIEVRTPPYIKPEVVLMRDSWTEKAVLIGKDGLNGPERGEPDVVSGERREIRLPPGKLLGEAGRLNKVPGSLKMSDMPKRAPSSK